LIEIILSPGGLAVEAGGGARSMLRRNRPFDHPLTER